MMDTTTGNLYDSTDSALAAGVDLRDLIRVEGSPEAVARVSRAVRHQSELDRRRAKAKRAKKSRKRNR